MTCKLAEYRAKANLSQRDLAERLGLAPSTIAMYERGLRIPPGNILIALASELGVKAEDILPIENKTANA